MAVFRKLLSMRPCSGREAAAAEPGEGLCGAEEVGDPHAAGRDCLSRQDDAHSALHCQGQQDVLAVRPPGVLLSPSCPSCCHFDKQDSTKLFLDKAFNSRMLIVEFSDRIVYDGHPKERPAPDIFRGPEEACVVVKAPSSLTSLHFTSLHFTSLHFTSLHFTSLH